MRLVRSNDDPKLIADLERLAGVEVVSLASTASSRPDVPIDDAFVRRFVQGSIHLRKYAPFYAGAGLWLGAMLLIQPLGSGRAAIADVAQPSGVRRAAAAPVAAIIPQAEPDVAGAPVFFSSGASRFSSDDVVASSEFSDFEEPEPAPTFAVEPSPSFAEPTNDFSSDTPTPAPPKPLAIGLTGYTSATGGTPLEQDPGDGGLPVGAAGGSDSKRSFITLTGDETVLRLKEAASGNANASGGSIKACPISTAGWTPARGKALASSPAYSSECVTGTRATTGVWTFDLTGFAPLSIGNGFALVPGAGTALTFQVVFAPVAVAAA